MSPKYDLEIFKTLKLIEDAVIPNNEIPNTRIELHLNLEEDMEP